MNIANFHKLIKSLQGLNDKQRLEIESALHQDSPSESISHLLEERLVEHPECPHCHSSLINRHGKTQGTQRYRCKNCLKTFVAATGTPLARLRNKERWEDYFYCMIKSMPLREAANHCDIALTTSFRWRHRFLQIPTLLQPSTLEGIIEADETFYPYSEKGERHLARKPRKRGMKAKKAGRSSDDWVKIVTVRDRNQHTYDNTFAHVTSDALTKELEGKVQKDSVLCSDGFKAYTKFSKDNELTHKRLNVSAGIRVIENVFHIQNVNSYHSQLKLWLAKFHGVATKYLTHYLGWFRFMDNKENFNENSLFKIQQQLVGT
ncbi:IS1595 family transposase [Shewanella sp. 202IG2-18]|uniref:IS1595 family transposase n=1 Tax=Parashewanella hymeniacidonis TaxID=2807618 RepID=UPI001961B1F0|nr:IS1595 family transposase [Parashewanella hymeniacidonis]MBM7074737.1 IS1595 family transposase [Parashewanella hymeniacidonis]